MAEKADVLYAIDDARAAVDNDDFDGALCMLRAAIDHIDDIPTTTLEESTP
jgi:hypothetical protein